MAIEPLRKDEDDYKVRQGPNSVYDQEKDSSPITRPNLEAIEGGGEGDGARRGQLGVAGSENDPNLQDREAAGGETDKGKIDDKESKLGKGFTGKAADKLTGFDMASGGRLGAVSRFFGRNKKQTAAATIITLLFGGGFLTFGILQGPFLAIHIGQLLKKFHFSSNEDFSSGRTFRTLIYANAGHAERGRLGLTANKAADIWEDQLAKKGFRPVYSTTGRFVGFQMDTDRGLFEADTDKKGSQIFEELAENDIDIHKASDLNKDGVVLHTTKDGPVDPDKHILYLGDNDNCDFKCRRQVIRAVGRQLDTGVMKAAGPLASRLLIKRAGINFHPFNKFKGKYDEAARKRILKKRVDEDKTGVKTDTRTKTATDDPDTPEYDGPDEGATQANEQTNEAIEELQKAEGGDEDLADVRGKLLVSGGATLAFGAYCAAHSFGKSIPEYKNKNVAKPMERRGGRALTEGNQPMSGDDIDTQTLGVVSQLYHDKKNKTSWNQANTIRQELGKEPIADKKFDLPDEAQLGSLTDKGGFFDALGSIPGLGTACDIQEAAFGLPVIKQVSGLVSTVGTAAIDAPLSAFGTSSKELAESALKAAAGQAVNMRAQGAELGNIVNTGAFLASNNQAMSMGGVPLSGQQVAELKAEEKLIEENENKSKSFAERYFNLENPTSLVASSLSNINIPTVNFSGLASPLNYFGSLSDSFASLISDRAQAASPQSIYGIPKYGFSLSEQDDEDFEDPFQNAVYIEDAQNNGKRLEELNNKYGKCFGMRVTTDDSGVHIETMDKDSPETNIFENLEKQDCGNKKVSSTGPKHNNKKTSGIASLFKFLPTKTTSAAESYAHSNDDPDFKRYRFYIADSLAALSAACFEADDEEACAKLGLGGDGSSQPEGSAGSIPGLEDISDINIEKKDCAVGSAPGGCYQLPESKYWDAWGQKRYPTNWMASKCMVQLVAATSKAWNKKYPDQKARVGDLNAPGHLSHKLGEDVDINTPTAGDTGQPGYSKQKSIEYAKLWLSTGNVEFIFFNDVPVQGPSNAYAKENKLSGIMMTESGHYDHFHVRIIDPKSDGSCAKEPVQ